jgi:glutamate-1-semialdehyde 2,1-aminomutase
MAGLLGIAPDLVTYGMVICGGFPVRAYGGREAMMDWVAPAVAAAREVDTP